MINNRDIIDLNDELIRLKKMDYYRFHSFLNSLEEIINSTDKIENEEARSVQFDFVRKVIKRFTEVYGIKKLPFDVRKRAQEIIIAKEWNFN